MPDTWYKLDNVARVFIASNTRRDPRVFRVSCTLAPTENEVDPVLLAQALEKTARQFPSFQVTLHRGLFWHYLESTDKRPVPVPEQQPPCGEIYVDGTNSLLYRVCYNGRRIHLEVFHVLTDGNGGMAFLKALVYGYLKLCHPEALSEIVPEYDASAGEQAQDGFRQYYSKSAPPKVAIKRSKVCHLHGVKLSYDQTQFFEAHLSASAALGCARAIGVTLTSWLAALLMKAIHAEQPTLERWRPVVFSVPVNLRNYYPTATARNFFNTVKVGHTFTGAETTAELAREIDAKLKEELSGKNVQAMMDGYEQLEHNVAIKPVPLWLKNKCVTFFNWLETKKETATISNMGRVAVNPAMKPYVSGFSSLSSTYSMFFVVSSYGDDLVVGASSVFRSTIVLKNFFRSLAAQGLELTLYATEVSD